MVLFSLRADKILLQPRAPLLRHRHTLLGLEVEGYHNGATLRKALIAQHDALVERHRLIT